MAKGRGGIGIPRCLDIHIYIYIYMIYIINVNIIQNLGNEIRIFISFIFIFIKNIKLNKFEIIILI